MRYWKTAQIKMGGFFLLKIYAKVEVLHYYSPWLKYFITTLLFYRAFLEMLAPGLFFIAVC